MSIQVRYTSINLKCLQCGDVLQNTVQEIHIEIFMWKTQCMPCMVTCPYWHNIFFLLECSSKMEGKGWWLAVPDNSSLRQTVETSFTVCHLSNISCLTGSKNLGQLCLLIYEHQVDLCCILYLLTLAILHSLNSAPIHPYQYHVRMWA